jgi:hypothetical protein
MTRKNRAAGRFMSKAASILEGQKSRPGSMEGFLKSSQKYESTNTDLRKTTIAQNHNCTNEDFHQTANFQLPRTAKTQKEELGRLHIQIRQDLMERLLEAVFKRKRDRNAGATQRAIIEEALEKYFMQKSVSSEAN